MGSPGRVSIADLTIEEAYEDIQHHIEDPGSYSHNIVTFTLRIVARDHGYAQANQMVDDLDLEAEFGIRRVE